MDDSVDDQLLPSTEISSSRRTDTHSVEASSPTRSSRRAYNSRTALLPSLPTPLITSLGCKLQLLSKQQAQSGAHTEDQPSHSGTR
jgi:hypothetical protein